MSEIGFFSPENQNLLLAALVAFAGAMFWLGAVSTKLYLLSKDVGKLKDDVTKLTIEFKADLLARRYLKEMEKKEQGVNEQ